MLLMEWKSSTVHDPVAPRLERPKGPTELGNPGNVNPNCFRLIFWSDSVNEPLTTGNRSLRARRWDAPACSVTLAARYNPRLYFSPRSSASSMVRSSVPGVALPCGIDPRNVSSLRLSTCSAVGKLDNPPALLCAQEGQRASRTPAPITAVHRALTNRANALVRR